MPFVFTVIFGLLWWWVYTRVGAGLTYLMILGSVLAVCACCCKGGGGGFEPGAGGWLNWSWQNFQTCLRRCWQRTVLLMLGLLFVGVIAHFWTTGAWPSGADLTNIVLAAIGAPFCVRVICCAYDS
jgi:hypothetical protein